MVSAAAVLAGIPAAHGHFRLESGYHTDTWLALDALFVDPRSVRPLVADLADLIRPHEVTGVCGPLLGGAFLAQALATQLEVEFYYTQRGAGAAGSGFFSAAYHLPSELRRRIRHQRVAIVDDVISAGSSVRATAAAVAAAEASVAVVAAFMVMGETGSAHFAERGVPVETLLRRQLSLWRPDDCPLCSSSTPLQTP